MKLKLKVLKQKFEGEFNHVSPAMLLKALKKSLDCRAIIVDENLVGQEFIESLPVPCVFEKDGKYYHAHEARNRDEVVVKKLDAFCALRISCDDVPRPAKEVIQPIKQVEEQKPEVVPVAEVAPEVSNTPQEEVKTKTKGKPRVKKVKA